MCALLKQFIDLLLFFDLLDMVSIFQDSVNFLMYLNTICKCLCPFLIYFLPYILLKNCIFPWIWRYFEESGSLCYHLSSSCLPMTTRCLHVSINQESLVCMCVPCFTDCLSASLACHYGAGAVDKLYSVIWVKWSGSSSLTQRTISIAFTSSET